MNHPLKASLIGSGMIADIHINAMRNIGIEVVGIYSLDMASAVIFAEKNHITVYQSLEELLTDDIELAAVCTPSGTHCQLAVALMEHGKHAVVEKPVVLTHEEGIRILETEKVTGKFCAPISQLRFSDTYQTVKNAIEHDAFGKTLLASLSMKYYRSPEYYVGSWHGTKAMDGGGALMNQGIHGIDLLCGLLGYPTQISGYAATLHHDIEVEDTAAVNLVFPSGALGVINASTAITHPKPRRLEICGTRASVAIEEDVLVSAEGIELTGGTSSGIQSWQNPAAFSADLHTAQYRNICAGIRSEEALTYTAQDAVNTVNVILAIYESSETGKTIIMNT